MPNIILTDEELQEVDRLLAEFDPEIHKETARLLEGLSDDDRKVVCAVVRETQRAAMEIAIGMRAVVEKVESTGVKAETLELEPRASMEDGWMDVLTCVEDIHPLHSRAMEIVGDDVIHWPCAAPALKFSRLEDIYAQSAPV